uniref:Glycoprotein-N-acetylgalactosamine 3-beta-galactosyltransferase 1 n=1 Tax=Glossina pallidipes TaxID=7398 RepID=A0A1A9ZHR4_GLOPL
MQSKGNMSPFKMFVTLIVGFLLGFAFAQLLFTTNCKITPVITISTSMKTKLSNCENPPKVNYQLYGDNEDMINSTNLQAWQLTENGEIIEILNQRQQPHKINRTLANRLFSEIRVVCWILTGPKNHAKKAIHVKRTWGSRCNKLLFMSSAEDEELGTIKLAVGEGRGNLWHKTREAMKYIYENHYNDGDWFLKADDDTYVILENLRAFLYSFSTDAPVYFGCKFKKYVRQGYMSGGAGYVLSKEALRRFALEAYPNRTICRQSNGGAEDEQMGYCLQNVGVVAGDSRDDEKRGRFFPFRLHDLIVPKNKSSWYWRYIFYATKAGLRCCSNNAISFHYIQPDYMYVLEYLIYNLSAFGISIEHHLPLKRNTSELVEKWRHEVSDNLLQSNNLL